MKGIHDAHCSEFQQIPASLVGLPEIVLLEAALKFDPVRGQ